MEIKALHLDEFKEKALVVAEVPGVIRFYGNYADYCNGSVLCGTDSRCLFVSVSKRSDSMVYMYRSDTKERKHFSVSSPKYRKEDKWANPFKGVVSELNSTGYKLGGMNITIVGDFFNSSAICVGFLLAVEKLLSEKFDKEYKERVCYNCCNIFCNEKCSMGIIKTLLNAQKGSYVLFNVANHKSELIEDPFEKDNQYCMVTVQSKIPPYGMKEEILNKTKEVASAINSLKLCLKTQTIGNVTVEDIREKAKMLSENERLCCTFVVEEHRLFNQLKKYVDNKDFSMLGKIMTKIEKMMRDNLELTCPEYDWLIKRSTELSSCAGSCLAMDGSNGVIVLVIKKDAVQEYGLKIEDYEHIFGVKTILSQFVPQGSAKVL